MRERHAILAVRIALHYALKDAASEEDEPVYRTYANDLLRSKRIPGIAPPILERYSKIVTSLRLPDSFDLLKLARTFFYSFKNSLTGNMIWDEG